MMLYDARAMASGSVMAISGGFETSPSISEAGKTPDLVFHRLVVSSSNALEV